MKRSAGILALVILTLLAGSARAERLRVLFTSDMHAHLLPFDDLRQRPEKGSVAQAATVIRRLRTEGVPTVVLDGGDAIEGTAVAHYELEAGRPDPTIAAMNAMGYDAATVGNHEFNFGLEVLRRALSESDFPWLAANLVHGREAGLPVRNDVILERGGLRIAVLGLTNPNIPHWEPPAHLGPLAFADPVEIARERLGELRRKADIVIVVVHSGFERDLETGAADDTGNENVAWRMAQLPGIDLLLTGHTHRNIPPRRLGETIVAQPGRWGQYVTRVDLDLVRSGGRVTVTGFDGANLATEGEASDPAVTAAVAAAEERTRAELARPIGTLTAPLEVGTLQAGDDPAVDLIHAVQLEASGAQLSLAAPLGGGRATFGPGEVTPRLVHALYPYPNTLVVVRLTGAEVRDVLEHAVRGWTGVGCGPDGPVLFRERTLPVYNYDTLEGVTYRVEPADPVGERIHDLRVGGQPIDLHASFTVVVNSYRASGGGGFPHLATAPRVREIDRPMADLIVEFFERHRTVNPSADDNFFVSIDLPTAIAQ